MPLATTAAQNAALDAVVASLPSPATWRLHTTLPDVGTEVPAGGGYGTVAYASSQWAAATDGTKVATVSFGTSSGAWADVATYWAIHDSAGAILLWDELSDPVEVSVSGTPVTVFPTLFFRSEF